MHRIALNGANRGRLRPSFFFLLALLCGAAQAQQPVYRCGQEYTNTPSEPARCERLGTQAVTVIPGTRVQATPAAPAVQPAGQGPARLEAAGQRQRDEMARAIVLAELDKARQRHTALLQDQQKAKGKPDDGSFKAALDRAQRDIDSLQRELDRRPAASAQP